MTAEPSPPVTHAALNEVKRRVQGVKESHQTEELDRFLELLEAQILAEDVRADAAQRCTASEADSGHVSSTGSVQRLNRSPGERVAPLGELEKTEVWRGVRQRIGEVRL